MRATHHHSLDDIVFENKNKAYGAYYNRITAGIDLMKSLFITIFGIGVLAFILSFTIKVDEGVNKLPHDVIVDLTDLPTMPKNEKPIEKSITPKIKTVVDDKTDIIPNPTKDPETQTQMRDNDELSTVVAGDIESDGDADTGIQISDNGNGSSETDSETNVEATEKTTYYVRDVANMAIFPGCEKFAGNNDKLQKCLSDQLNKELSGQLTEFEVIANRQGIDQAVAKLQFIIDKSGRIIEIKTLNGGNKELSLESRDALEKISKRMVQKGKYIKPASFKDGTPVNLIFTIPVKFVSN